MRLLKGRKVKEFADTTTGSIDPPIQGESAGHGSNSISQFGDTTARIGIYNPDKIGFSTYAKMLDHFQVGAGADLIALPLYSASLSCEGDPLISEYVLAMTNKIWDSVIRACSRAVLVGCAPNELIYERMSFELKDEANGIDTVHEGWAVSKVKDIDPASLTNLLVDGLENFTGATLTVPSGEFLPSEKMLHFAYDIRYGNYWGNGRLKRAYEPWYRFMVIWDQSVRYLEKMATPPTKVFYVPGKDHSGNDNADAAESIGAGITGESTYISVPLSKKDSGEYYKSWDVELLQDSQRGRMYLDALDKHAQWMLRAMLIPDSVFTQQASTGSLALSQTHADTYLEGEDGVLRQIVAAYNNQVIPRIVRWTFGADAPVPRLITGGLTDEAKQFFGDIFKLAVQGGQVQVAWDKVADRLGISTGDDSSSGDLSEAKHEIARLAEAVRDKRLYLMAQE